MTLFAAAAAAVAALLEPCKCVIADDVRFFCGHWLLLLLLKREAGGWVENY